MPTITVEKQDLCQLLGRDYTLNELEPLMDYVKGELKDYTLETDELKIELKDTNRPDLWCPEGVARQIRFTQANGAYVDFMETLQTSSPKQVLVDADIQPIRPYIGAFIAIGVPVSEAFLIQMIQTQEKLCDGYGKHRELIAIGIYNADKIRFPVHYNASDPHGIRFVPLGNEESMDLAEILEKHPKGQEYAGILHGKRKYPLLVDDTNDVLSFPPVINSRTSGEVLVGDQHLFVEITGLDLNMTLHALNILAYSFYDRGFQIEPVQIVYPYDTLYGRAVMTPYALDNSVDVESALFSTYLGQPYNEAEIIAALKCYGVKAEPQPASGNQAAANASIFKVSTLPYRQDYMHAVDAVEDLAIAIGYNHFEPIMPERFTVGSMQSMTLLEDRVRDHMIGFGFEEVILNILTNKADYSDRVNSTAADLLEISNPMSESYAALRNSLLPSLLKVEASSGKSLYPHRVFEVGEVVIRDAADNQQYATRSRLGALLAHSEANFSEMGSYLMHLSYLLFWELTIRAQTYPLFIAGRSGEIVADGLTVGRIGEVHPAILEKWGIKMPTVLFELDLSLLFSAENR